MKVMSLADQVAAEQRAAFSPRKACSPELSDALRAAVGARMHADGLTFQSAADSAGVERSGFRRWVVESRPSQRSGHAQSISLFKAARIAAWLWPDAAPAPAPAPAPAHPPEQVVTDAGADLLDIVECRARATGCGSDADIAAAAGCTTADVAALRAGRYVAALEIWATASAPASLNEMLGAFNVTDETRSCRAPHQP